jgi:hypothetical protein
MRALQNTPCLQDASEGVFVCRTDFVVKKHG